MKILLAICFLFVAIKLRGQEKTFEREYTYKAGEMDSKFSCRAIAINQLRSILLNEIGVYVESESILKTTDVSGKFAQDFVENITTISAGITKFQILQETWNGEVFWMKAAITIDEKSLEESLKQLVNDRVRIRELERLKRDLNISESEIKTLREALKNERNKNEQAALALKYKKETDRLSSFNYLYNGLFKSKYKAYSEAISDFTMAIELNPLFEAAYVFRAIAKFQLDDCKGSIADCDLAIKLDPNDAVAYEQRGLCKDILNDPGGALNDFNAAIKEDPKIALFYRVRGLLRLSYLKDRVGAMEDYNTAIFLGPEEDFGIYYLRGLQKINTANEYFKNKSRDIQQNNPKTANQEKAREKQLVALEEEVRILYGSVLQDFDKAIEIELKGSVFKKVTLAQVFFMRGSIKVNALEQASSGCLDFKKSAELGYEMAIEEIRKYCK